jgi:hypothetical protein
MPSKTLSYLLPTLADIDPTLPALQALKLVPTRELGLQVSRVAKRLASSGGGDGGNAKSDGNVSSSTNVHVDDDNKDGKQDEDVDVELPTSDSTSTSSTATKRKKILVMSFLQGRNIDVNGPVSGTTSYGSADRGFRFDATRSTQNMRVHSICGGP